MKVQWKRVVPVLAIAGMLLLPMSVATAVDITVNGDISDWVQNASSIYTGANPTDGAFSAKTGVLSWIEDGCSGSQGYVGPGYGGQNFDMEAMYAYYDSTGSKPGLYVAIVTGFDPDGVKYWGNVNPTYLPGDIFFDFGGNGSWDMAVETSPGGTQGYAYTGSGTSWYTAALSPYSDVGPAEIDHSAASLATDGDDPSYVAFEYVDKVTGGSATVSELGTVDDPEVIDDQWDNQDTSNGPYASASGWNQYDHNVIELYLSDDFLQANHWQLTTGAVDVLAFATQQCGNDYSDMGTVSIPEVPEPVTMVMLGCLGAGMLGARAAARRRKTEK